MPLTFRRRGRVLTALALVIIWAGINSAHAQENTRFEMRSGYDGNATDPNYVLKKGEELSLSWGLFPDGFSQINTLAGQFSVYLSKDKNLDKSDQLYLTRTVEVTFYQYRTDTIPEIIPAGNHFLICTFTTEQSGFEKTCEALTRTVMVMDVTTALQSVTISHFKTSEYEHNTKLDVSLELHTKCCAEAMGNLNGYLKVFLSTDTSLNGKHIELATFYPDQTVTDGSNVLRFQQDLISVPAFDEYQFVVVSLEEAYFANAYRNKFNKRYSTPLKVVTDVADVNAHRRKDHPWLTYGTFKVDPAGLEGMDTESLSKAADTFYDLIEQVLIAAAKPDAAAFLEAADSAFAHVGRNEVSSLLYVHPNTVSALYSLYYDIAENDPTFGAYADLEKIGFRLGEAMNMATLMDSAYARLHRSIFPEDLDVTNAVESSGYFNTEGGDPFRHGAIRNPVLWRDVSAPAVDHYLRISEFEEADLIITIVRQVYDRALGIGRLATPLTQKYPRAGYLTDALVHDSDVWEFYLAALRFYSVIGDYDAGISIYNQLAMLSRSREEIFLTDFRKASAGFFETFHAFEKADSLYRTLDAFHIQRSEKLDSPVEACYAFNSAAFQERLAPGTNAMAATGKDFAKRFAEAKDGGSWFAFDELVNDKSTAFKYGIFSIPGYDTYYLSRIQMLQTQDQYFAASELQKDLAFFLARDKRYEDAFAVYQSLFPVENVKLTAFRGSFNEEAQLFNTAGHMNEFSRYVNLLLEMPASLPETVRHEALMTGFEQMLFYHSFILRGNFRLLYNVIESKDPFIQGKFEIWKAYKALLNQVYVSDDVNTEDLKKVKAALVETEKELQRVSRDSLYFLEGRPVEFEKLRAQLNPGEVAVEMMRIKVNHEHYYGAGIRYVAFIVTKESETPHLVSWDTPGELLEGRYFNYYRNSIKNKITDTISYGQFLEPLMRHLGPSVKRIHFAPDGVFNLLNPATIVNPSSGVYVNDEVEFNHITSIASVGTSEELDLKDGAFFGFPKFTMEESGTSNAFAGTSRRTGMLADPVAELPGTRTEVETIGKLLKDKGIRVKTYLGSDVTKKNIYNTRKASVLHFATHGYWLDEQSSGTTYTPYASLSHSALLLSGAQIHDAHGYHLRREGVLTAAEIQNLDLFGTDLVVLSACETGLGEVVPGEGIYGLRRAFQRAGVKHLVSSLWKVDDAAAQKFMQYFYSSLVEEKKVDAAFQHAVARLKEQYPEPYYWGAFTMTRFY